MNQASAPSCQHSAGCSRAKRNHPAETDAEFDARMPRSRAGFIEHYNATFDFEAGLDEVHAQAGLTGGCGSAGLRRKP
jgi:hypothetical protein